MTPRQLFQNTIVIILTLVATYVLWMGARIVLDLLVAVIIASALRPLIVRLERRKVPAGVAILGVYSLLIFIILGTLALVLPSMFGNAHYYIANDSQLTEHILTVQTNFETTIEDITHKDVELLSDGKVETLVKGINKRDCMTNLAATVSFTKLQKQLFHELKQHGDPRMLGKGHIYDEYPYGNESKRNFYDRIMRGEKMEPPKDE